MWKVWKHVRGVITPETHCNYILICNPSTEAPVFPCVFLTAEIVISESSAQTPLKGCKKKKKRKVVIQMLEAN